MMGLPYGRKGFKIG